MPPSRSWPGRSSFERQLGQLRRCPWVGLPGSCLLRQARGRGHSARGLCLAVLLNLALGAGKEEGERRPTRQCPHRTPPLTVRALMDRFQVLREQNSSEQDGRWRCCTTRSGAIEQQQGQTRKSCWKTARMALLSASTASTAGHARHQPSPNPLVVRLLSPRTTMPAATGYREVASPRAAPCSAAYWARSAAI